MNINQRDGDSVSILPKKMAVKLITQAISSVMDQMAVKLITQAISSVMDQMPVNLVQLCTSWIHRVKLPVNLIIQS